MAQQRFQRISGEGVGEKKPLTVLATEELELRDVRGNLDSLCDSEQAEIAPHGDDGVQERHPVSRVHVPHEGAVYFESPERELVQVAERRVSRSKVIECEHDAAFLER